MTSFDFEKCNDLNLYWLSEDALRSLDYDLYFSLGTRYYCAAGCGVCYIRDNLKITKNLPVFGNDLSKLEEVWFKFFDYFGVVRTNDDMYLLKHQYPLEYEWYKKHGKKFELCMTDNAIFRTLELDDLELKGIGDISLSTEFLKAVGVEKVLTAVKQLYEKHGIQKVKYIDCGNPELFKPVIEWVKKLGLDNCVHHDFRTDHRELLDADYSDYQNTWVINDSQGLMQIYKESLHLYYDRFYYSSDDASDINILPFYQFTDSIDVNEFIAAMIQGKINKYDEIKDRCTDKKFKEYFYNTQHYKVNRDFNFIPGMMFPATTKFFYEMEKDGWVRTALGLFKPADTVTPLLER
jgi:hypothetical protein